MADTVSQNNFIDNQDANIDIPTIYINVIQEIDKYRSHVSISNNAGNLQLLLQALAASIQPNTNADDPDKYITRIKPETTPQENRCHTFYRLIGLPVIAPDGSLYSPGYDSDNIFNKEIVNQHYQVILAINNQKPDLFKIMDDREANANGFLKIFSLSNTANNVADINASVLALSSVGGGKVRTFNASLENSDDPFDTVIKNQSYAITDQNSIGSHKLSDYTDASNNPPTQLLSSNNFLKEAILNRRAHILKPFIVDPRVDLTVNPPERIICAPFATNTLYTENIYLVRPFIEFVCRGRFNKDNITGVKTAYFQNIEDFIKSTDAVTDQSLLTIIAQGSTQTVEDTIFTTNFNIMRAMINELYEAIQKIQEAETKFHWIPIPDPSGLEAQSGGKSLIRTQDIILQSITDPTTGITTARIDPLSTTTDIDIITKTSIIALSNVNSQNTTPDLGNFAFSNIQPLPDGKTTAGFGSRLQNVLDDLISNRKELTDNAAESLRIIEIIMGEFTGLGLCDIIAIYTALWTVDPTVLVNMLDDQAFNRLYADPTLRNDVVESRHSAGNRTLSGQDALQMFENKVKEMYNLMNKLFDDRKQNIK
jgi:hypothetical protein